MPHPTAHTHGRFSFLGRAGGRRRSSEDQEGVLASPANAKQRLQYKRKRKDKDAPKRALPGYNFFIRDIFAKQKKKGEEVSMSTVGRKWQELSPVKKSHYQKRYAIQKETVSSSPQVRREGCCVVLCVCVCVCECDARSNGLTSSCVRVFFAEREKTR